MKISKITTDTILVLSQDDFKQAVGIDTYKGIIIMFDEDFDQRIFLFLKNHYEGIRPCVKAVYETHGTLTLYCYHTLNAYTKNLIKTGASVGLDTWQIELKDITGEVIINDK